MVVLLTGVTALAACGGGGTTTTTTTTGGMGGESSTTTTTSGMGGEGGHGSTVTSAATTSATTATGTSTGVGGAGTTTGATTTTATSGTGGAGTGVLGSPCASDAVCAGGLCLDEATQGWPAGYCSAVCDQAAPACPDNGVCVDDGSMTGSGICLQSCTVGPNGCAAAYSCLDFGVGNVCYPTCTAEAQCTAFCDADTGFCSATDEDCANGMDDDADNLVDCEDLDCKATCGGQITAACTMATPAAASNMGDTSLGSFAFAGSCTGAGSHEVAFSLTPGVAGEHGTLTATVSSALDLGIYARLACSDPSTQIACVDLNAGRTDEVLVIELDGGTPITLFVDGYSAGQEGPFTLTTSYQDNAPLCAAALPEAIGDTVGDTTLGTNAFTGSCTGSGVNEQVYTFLPAADGTLHLNLSSQADMGVYVRTTCLDKTTELGCADVNIGGIDETLDVPVKSGVAVTVFVDGYRPSEVGAFTLTATLM
ncbi:MAG: hypothetical protein ABJE95_04360 [Byssovorax sp.]